MPTPLLTTKLYLPPARPTLVPRPRLTTRVSEGLTRPLTLISAPAGFGKTTLVSEWRATEAGRNVPLGWLSLDDDDNDAARFLTYLIAALATLQPGLGGATRALLESPQPPPAQAILTNLINDLNQVMGLALSADDVRALESRTEGWIAGLQLAALSMHGLADRANFIAAFTGSHHYIVDYLAEEVLSRQSETVRTFLLQTSILDRLTAPLCNTLTGRADGQATLEAIEQANLFVIPLDDERRWYRYHHLFADVLRNRLGQLHPDRLPDLHRLAAQWLEHAALFEDAVQHAMAAEDYEFAARLIAGITRKVLERESVSVTARWLNGLPKPLVFSHPVLSIDYAWVLAFSGNFDEVEPALQLIEKAMRGESSTPEGISFRNLLDGDPAALSQTVGGAPTRSRLPAIIDLVRAFVERFRDPQKAKMYCERALQQIPVEDKRDHSTALVFLGHALLLNGEAARAEHVLLDAIREGRSLNIHSVYLSAVNYLAQQFVLQGKLREAMALLSEAARYVEAQPEPILAGIERIRLGDIQREWNDLTAASENISQGVRQAESGGDFIILFTTGQF